MKKKCYEVIVDDDNENLDDRQYETEDMAIKDAIERVKHLDDFKEHRKICCWLDCLVSHDFQDVDFFDLLYDKIRHIGQFSCVKHGDSKYTFKNEKLIDEFNSTIADAVLKFTESHNIKLVHSLQSSKSLEIINTHFGVVALLNDDVVCVTHTNGNKTPPLTPFYEIIGEKMNERK